MSPKRLMYVAWLTLIAASPAHASFSGGSSSPSSDAPKSQEAPAQGVERTARQDASPYYGDAYNDVEKGKKELASGKAKNAEKRFRRAIERGERAAEIDTTYFEAWNLVGYCHRQLREYEPSVAAYEKSLKLNPDYAAAREYLGETYVAMGKLDLAREQLAWLEQHEQKDDASSLKAAVDAYVASHPEAAPAATPSATNAPAGSTPAEAAADTTSGH